MYSNDGVCGVLLKKSSLNLAIEKKSNFEQIFIFKQIFQWRFQERITSFSSRNIILEGKPSNHRTNMFSPYLSNSCHMSAFVLLSVALFLQIF